ncbi:HAD family hydrolase [Rhizobium sp. Root483D2]|nr:TIGR01459 family HAD-type hydrolase [Rhizobium sp. Root483D2]KQY26594.1 HAD family hydrolase [Rhizobium sp. Root483D2]
MSMMPLTARLEDLIANYDVFLIDQFGVLRDDIGAYPGAPPALAALKKAGKVVIILSNSGRSGDYNADRLVALGFERSSFDRFVTSGDVAYEILSQDLTLIRGRTRCLTISSGGDTNLADRLGLTTVDDAFDADVVVISGSEAERISLEDYRALLRPAAEKNAPCYCTNPDIHKLAGGTVAPGAGSLAKLYEELGGAVKWLGKPHSEIYHYARSVLSLTPSERIVCIGDSIEHDIVGATNAGLPSALVETGIMSGLSSSMIRGLLDQFDVTPTYLLERFGLVAEQ